jgi:hypothetical protein
MLAQIAALESQDPHITWAARLDELFRVECGGLDEATYEATMDEIFVLRDRIAETPTKALAGVAAQIWLTIDAYENGCAPGECEILALKNAMATLARLQAQA